MVNLFKFTPALAVTVFKWMLNISILAYIVVLSLLFSGSGSGVEIDLGLFSIKSHTPSKPFLSLIFLVFLRYLISLEIKNAILVLVSLLFSLGAAEVALRIADIPVAREPELIQWRQPSKELGWELIPNLNGRGFLGSTIQINSHGLRGNELARDKAKDVYRILGLGDSFTFGYGLNHEETYLFKLGALLNGNEMSVEVINAGVIGYSLYQSLEYLKLKGIHYAPDLIIFFYYIDDLTGITSQFDVARVYAELLKSENKGRNYASLSYLYNLIKNSIVLIDVRFRSRTEAGWLKSIDKRQAFLQDRMQEYAIDDNQLNLLREQLIELKSESQKIGADLLIVSIPDAAQIGNPDMQKPYKTLSKVCTELRIFFLDITDVFEQQTTLESFYLFPMDAHTSARGNAIIASAVHKYIVDEILK